MVEIIGEFSHLSKAKVWVERNHPTIFEYCYLHPLFKIQDYFNTENTHNAIDNWNGKPKLIEIETINRCNGSCKFCPVSHGNDPRQYRLMSSELFRDLIMQIGWWGYTGWLSLQSNNEPLLDKRLFDMLQFARESTFAKLQLFTNGTLLTVDKFEKLIKVLDHLYLDNYQINSELTPASRMALEYIKDYPEYSDKLTVLVSRPDAKRGSRAGLVKNRIFQQLKSPCIFPFEQIIVRPDGKVSLCCNDAVGTMTLADLTRERIEDAWMNNNYMAARYTMEWCGRQGIDTCKYCDTLNNSSGLVDKIRRYAGGNKQ
jgi:MoaA/NifB/PqqE/SkfB family radical SAM enzyme